MQLTSLEPLGSKHKGIYTDGSECIDAIFGNKANQRLQAGDIAPGCVLKLEVFVCNEFNGVKKLITTEMELEAAADSSTAQEGSGESGAKPMQTSSPSKENQPSNVKAEETVGNTGTPMANKKPKINHNASKSPWPGVKSEPESMKTPVHPRIASLAASSRTPQPSPSEQ